MPITVQRKSLQFIPDSSRVVARFFDNGDQRTIHLVHRIMDLDDRMVTIELNNVLREFVRSEEHTSELQSRGHIVCRLLLEKKKKEKENYYVNNQRNKKESMKKEKYT